jgi:zinc protease
MRNARNFFVALSATLLLTACDHVPNIESLYLENTTETKVEAPVRATPKVQEVEIAGVKAWLVQDESQPLFSIQLIFEGAGSSSDPKDLQGRAMFASSLLDEGAGDMDALAFQRALDSHAIELAIQTDEDALVINLRSLSEHKEEAFRLLGLALSNPRFDNDAIARKRALALSTLKQAKSNPRYLLRERFRRLAYPNHPYGNDEIGTEASLKKLSRSDLQNYASNLIAKDNLIISVAGDVDAGTLKTLLEKSLALLPATSQRPPIEPTAIHALQTVEVVEQPIPQSMVLFSTPAIGRKDPRFMAGYVLNHIIGGDTLTSKLGTAIREERGLAYSVNSSLDPMQYSASWGGMFATRNEQAGEAFSALKGVANAIRTQGVSEDDLAHAKSYLTGAFVRSLDTNAELTNYLNLMQRFDLGKDYLATRNAQIDAVTLDEVNQLAKDWLDSTRWLVVVVGKPKELVAESKGLSTP